MSTLPAETIERREASGPLTAEGLLRRRANQRPGIAALADPPNVEALGLGRPRSFNYRQADAGVDALAQFFIELGLLPGDIVAVQLPNIALSPLTLLAAWRAGLTVAMLPMLWRAHEIGKVCDEIAPKALIGVSRFAGESHARRSARHRRERKCRCASCSASGPICPTASSRWMRSSRPGARAPVRSRQGRGEGPLLVTFTARPGLPFLPVMRNEEELLAQGAMTVLALDLDTRDVILNPYPLTGPAGLSLGLTPWLVSGATLVQHHPFDYDAFVTPAARPRGRR